MTEQPKTLNQAILSAMETYAAQACYKIRRGSGPYQDISYRQFRQRAFLLARYFREQGVHHGERVALIADNCVEWMITLVACHLSGGVIVPMRPTFSPKTLTSLLEITGTSLVVVDSIKLCPIFDNPNRIPTSVKTVITLSESDQEQPTAVPIRSIIYKPLPEEEAATIKQAAQNVEPDALASIQFTGAEIGQPQGALFTQAHRLRSMQHLADWLSFEEDDMAFTFLPWSSAATLDISLHCFLMGLNNTLAEFNDTIMEEMQQTSPTLMLITPFGLERFYHRIMNEMSELPESSQEVFQWALTIGKEYLLAGSEASIALQEGYTRADMTFFSQIRAKVGGRLRRIYTVGASQPQHLADFIEAIGMFPLNIYSVTEAGGFPAVSQPEARRARSCGRPAPGFQIKIADDGEVLIKAALIMKEYWQQPAETSQVIDEDGWLYTGDLGYLDDDGYLYLTGRKKLGLTLSSGHKVIPSTIEKALKESPYVAQAAVFGENRPYVSVLIVPDLERLATHIEEDAFGIEAPAVTTVNSGPLCWFWMADDDEGKLLTTAAHPFVQAKLDQVVETVNQNLDRWEKIRRYSLLEQAFSPAADDLAGMTDQNRHTIAGRYAAHIESMYPQMPLLTEREITQVQVTPERLRALLEKENILDAWMGDAGIQFLFDLARQKQIDTPSIVHICDTAASIAQMENEERPLSTALIVGDPVRIARKLPASQIQLLRFDHIRRLRRMLVTLASMVDGTVLGFVVDKHGFLRGIHKLEIPRDQYLVDPRLGPQFRHHAALSRECEALVFFVPSGGKQVRVFAHGQLVGRYANGDWSPDHIARVDTFLDQMGANESLDLELLNRILRCAFWMSEENLGAIFIIGKSDRILNYADSPEISHSATFIRTHLDSLDDEELINFAKQGGATVIDIRGTLENCTVLLRPSAHIQAEVDPGRGARHSSAAKMSAEASCLAIVVSQDGPITIYRNGKRELRL